MCKCVFMQGGFLTRTPTAHSFNQTLFDVSTSWSDALDTHVEQIHGFVFTSAVLTCTINNGMNQKVWTPISTAIISHMSHIPKTDYLQSQHHVNCWGDLQDSACEDAAHLWLRCRLQQLLLIWKSPEGFIAIPALSKIQLDAFTWLRQQGWSHAKKSWCCSHKNKGCPGRIVIPAASLRTCLSETP